MTIITIRNDNDKNNNDGEGGGDGDNFVMCINRRCEWEHRWDQPWPTNIY